MKSLQENKQINKPLVIILSSIALAIIAACTYVYAFNGNILGWTNGRSSDTNFAQDTPTPEQKEAEQTNSDAQKTDAAKTNQDAPPSPPEQSTNVQVTITSVNQTTNTLQVRGLIASQQTQGKCTLTLERAGRQPVTQTADIQTLHGSATCQGFDVPLYQLTAGTWNITLDFKNGNVSGRATTTVTIT